MHESTVSRDTRFSVVRTAATDARRGATCDRSGKQHCWLGATHTHRCEARVAPSVSLSCGPRRQGLRPPPPSSAHTRSGKNTSVSNATAAEPARRVRGRRVQRLWVREGALWGSSSVLGPRGRRLALEALVTSPDAAAQEAPSTRWRTTRPVGREGRRISQRGMLAGIAAGPASTPAAHRPERVKFAHSGKIMSLQRRRARLARKR